jgi:hypothetical protein
MELALCLVALFGLAGIGTPIGYAIILAAVVYMGFADLDAGLVGEKIVVGLYKSFVSTAERNWSTGAA